MSDKAMLFELKEKAKWSRDPEEKKAAIRELSAKGPSALPQLEEIFNITAFEDIRDACAEAIRSIKATAGDESENSTTADRGPGTPSTMARQPQKKEEKQGEEAAGTELRLADLPP
jgi:hypothetical protein